MMGGAAPQAHLFLDLTGRTLDESAPTQSSACNALMGLRSAQTLLGLGFTTIRIPGDMDYHYANIDLRDAIERGWHQGPRMRVAPHAISPLGGHGDFNSYAADLPHQGTGPFIADGVDEVRRAVRREINYGADWIKVMASGGVMSQHDDPEVAAYTAEEFRAFADETHRHGKKITAHAHGGAGARPLQKQTNGPPCHSHSFGRDLSSPRSMSPWRCLTTPSARVRLRTSSPNSTLSSWAAAVKLAEVTNTRSSSATRAFACRTPRTPGSTERGS